MVTGDSDVVRVSSKVVTVFSEEVVGDSELSTDEERTDFVL